MVLPNLNKVGNDIWRWTAKHSPEILTGMGIAGMVSAIVLAVSATPKALSAIEEKKKEEDVEQLNKVEVVKVTWKYYVPTVATSAVSIACIIGASSINYKRNAALEAAYSLVDSSFRTYRKKVVEAIGDKKEEEINNEVEVEKMKKTPYVPEEVEITGYGDALCYDPTRDKFFRTSLEYINRVECQLNRKLNGEFFVSLNDYYDLMGFKRGTSVGDDIGWNMDKYPIEIRLGHGFADDGFTPVTIVDFYVGPRWDFRGLH